VTHSEEEREHAYKIFQHLSSREICEEEGSSTTTSEAETDEFRFQAADVVLNVEGIFHAKFSHPVEIW